MDTVITTGPVGAGATGTAGQVTGLDEDPHPTSVRPHRARWRGRYLGWGGGPAGEELGQPGDAFGAIRIAVIPGTTTEQMVKSAIASMGAGADAAKLVAVKDHADGLAAVVDRRADVYATDRAILMGLVTSASNPRQFALLDRYLSYEPYALMLRRGDPEFRLAVNRSLARLYRSGQVLDIYRRWFGQWGDPSPLTLGMYAVEGLPE